MLLIAIWKIKVAFWFIHMFLGSLVSMKLLLRHRPILFLLTKRNFKTTWLEWYGHNKRSCHLEKTFWATKHSPPKQDISQGFLKLYLVAEPNIKTYDMWNYHIFPLVEGSLGNFSWSFPTNSFSFQMAELKELCETVWKPLFYFGSYNTTACIRMIRKAWWSAYPDGPRWLKSTSVWFRRPGVKPENVHFLQVFQVMLMILVQWPHFDNCCPTISSTRLLNITKTRITYILLLCN